MVTGTLTSVGGVVAAAGAGRVVAVALGLTPDGAGFNVVCACIAERGEGPADAGLTKAVAVVGGGWVTLVDGGVAEAAVVGGETSVAVGGAEGSSTGKVVFSAIVVGTDSSCEVMASF